MVAPDASLAASLRAAFGKFPTRRARRGGGGACTRFRVGGCVSGRDAETTTQGGTAEERAGACEGLTFGRAEQWAAHRIFRGHSRGAPAERPVAAATGAAMAASRALALAVLVLVALSAAVRGPRRRALAAVVPATVALVQPARALGC